MRHGRNCGCPKCVVHPTKHNVVHQCTEETIQHIHPSHTTVVNHHLIKNQHVFPHSTSFQNNVNSVDQYGGSFNVPAAPGMGLGPAGPAPGQVAGAFDPGAGLGPGMGPGGPGGPGQVAGAFEPGMGPGMGAGPWGTPTTLPGQVAGAMSPGMGPGAAHGWGKKPKC
ncbi:spore coat protein [Ornithinibacillus sp. 179-J 7C1 HS]|uniref:spore coat protein n=1 Tax=Ornithinibacillus sp. 179-J 7C1 HS TaxID=3142384 RepID=UPI0039A009D8